MFEIGTFIGGMSVFLATQCLLRETRFLTFDNVRYSNPDHPAIIWSGVRMLFRHLDVFSPEFEAELNSALLVPGPLVLFCDGGDKPKEMQTFVPRLRPGDFAVCHDWGNEIGEADLDGLPIAMVMADECANLHSLTRFFMRV